MSLQKQLHQWFTPAWAAEAIVDEAFGWLGAEHRVVEPSCGDGAFLCALPKATEVIGVEIDPLQAARAARSSARQVIVGDFMTVPAEDLGRVHAILGNPPFQADIVAGFLRKSHEILEEGGQVGFVLPAFVFQSSAKVERMSEQFTVQQSMIPRNLFPRLSLPLVFATFTKERHRRLIGFMLYREAQEIRAIDKCWRDRVAKGREPGGVWLPVVREILASLGGSPWVGRQSSNRSTAPFRACALRQIPTGRRRSARCWDATRMSSSAWRPAAIASQHNLPSRGSHDQPITMKNPSSEAALQAEVDRFNAAVEVGNLVDYFEYEGAPLKRHQTRTPAQILSGHTAVVWLAGKSGCVCVSHCVPVPAAESEKAAP